jgi:predicted ATPase/DNA-binding CsgD family transcriptional regulator
VTCFLQKASGEEPTMQDNIFLLPSRQAPAEPGWGAPTSNLPAPLTALIGREHEVAALCALLRRPQVRLVTFTGTGGVGKTRLALAGASKLLDDFADGIYFVSLAPLSDPDLVLPTIAQTFHLKETADWLPLEHLKSYLHEKRLLLLLDNFEQVVTAAPLLVELLQACPALKMLVTSRLRLRVSGEQEFPVPPLALPDPQHLPENATLMEYAAVALFVQRAQALKPTFQLTAGNARALAEICLHLDGLPLAIELAAARIKLLSPQALLARLSHRLQVLTAGVQDAPVRQQTLRNTIAWSYDLLTAQEQRLFRRLSVFVGGCTLEAIEAVSAAVGDGAVPVLERVASLIDKSLLQQTAQEGEEPRLLMLETIREYGLEGLAMSGEQEATRREHAAYCLVLAEEAQPKLEGPQQAVWLERLEREHENLRAALQWLLDQAGGEEAGSSRERALRLSAALRQFWLARGHLSEGQMFLERALAGGEGIVTSNRAQALRAAASLALVQGKTDRGEALCEESLTLCRELGDTEGIAHSLYLRGSVVWQRNDLAAAGSLFEEALALWRELGDKDGVGWALQYLAWLASQQGEHARARALCEESVATHRKSGNKRGLAHALCQLAQVLFVSQGDRAVVHSLLEESLTLSKELGDKVGLADYFSVAGQLALEQGDATMARSLLEEGLALYREIGDLQEGISESLSILGKVAAVQDDYTKARAYYEESLAFPGKVDAVWIASSLEGLAGVVAAQGEPAWVARLYGTAETLRESVGIPIPPVERAAYEQAVAAARAQLGEKAFTAAWAEGRTMTPEQALAAREPATLPEVPQMATTVKTLPTYPAGLTAREVEVLRLLAQGMTNAQIADRLVISLHTVNAHVRSIFNKLDVNSRNAVTRFALEHNLL